MFPSTANPGASTPHSDWLEKEPLPVERRGKDLESKAKTPNNKKEQPYEYPKDHRPA
jgi:hypothetical protein